MKDVNVQYIHKNILNLTSNPRNIHENKIPFCTYQIGKKFKGGLFEVLMRKWNHRISYTAAGSEN